MTDNIDKLIESISEEYGNVNEENNKPQKQPVVSQKEKFVPIHIHNEKSKTRPSKNNTVNRTEARNSKENFKRSAERQQTKVANKKPTGLKKTMKIVFDVLFYAFILLLISGSALFALNGNQQKDFLGFQVYTVKTNSMLSDGSEHKDGFAAGDILIVKKTPYADLKVGDVITFSPGEESKAYLTHRIVEKISDLNGEQGEFLMTKGDANEINDSPFNAKLVSGKKIFTIPKVGPLILFVRNNFVVSLVFIISFFGFIFAIKHYFSKEEI
ncbi:signal peptidase I [Isobaculum melis]|uniref:Signal peptidase I n=1 Tax=Isobaculum melis TaxID=142588 RepID=A0A1H9RJ00_9LACT|nr:signal peptidase I [Isobaculum melis]SER72811.1 Peptidase S24-like [Isobaculum melis]